MGIVIQLIVGVCIGIATAVGIGYVMVNVL